MKYVIRIRENRRDAIELEHPDAIYANMVEGSYVPLKYATKFRTYDEAKNECIIEDEEVIEYDRQ